MAVFRVEKNRNYTVMSNVHLKDRGISLKAKGLLSVILSLPEDWNYTTRGLAAICKEGVDSIGAALRELESAGYLIRHRLRDKGGRISDTEYIVYESPHKTPEADSPYMASPCTENPWNGSEAASILSAGSKSTARRSCRKSAAPSSTCKQRASLPLTIWTLPFPLSMAEPRR